MRSDFCATSMKPARQSVPVEELSLRDFGACFTDADIRQLVPMRRAGAALRKVGTLSDLDDISVRIADVAANLAVFGDRLCEELRTSTFP